MRIILLLIASAVTAICAAPPAPSDGSIQAAIQAKFAKSKIADDHFKVAVRGGIAYIEGRTDIPQRKGVATRLAKSGGAKQVVNNIQVGEAARKKLTERLQKARESKPNSTKAPAAATPKSSTAPAVDGAATAPAPVAATEPPLRRMQIKR